jgi:hypothetical protein
MRLRGSYYHILGADAVMVAAVMMIMMIVMIMMKPGSSFTRRSVSFHLHYFATHSRAVVRVLLSIILVAPM